MRGQKETPGIRNLEFYKEKSPLLKTFLTGGIGWNKQKWFEGLREQFEIQNKPELDVDIDIRWSEITFSLQLLISNFGLIDLELGFDDAFDVTSYLYAIGYEIRDLKGAEVVLPEVCKRLRGIGYIYKDYYKRESSKFVAHRLVEGVIKVGVVCGLSLEDGDDRLGPFRDLMRGLDLSGLD